MPRDLRAYLLDIVNACDDIQGYTANVTAEAYRADKMRRLAVERSYTIAGEALVRAGRLVPDITSHLPSARAVIGFRNVLVHNYSNIDENQVWILSRERVPRLRREAERWLAEVENAADED